MMTLQQRWQEALESLPLIAILRGVRPPEVAAIGESLLQAGLRIIEIPLNSPDAVESVATLIKTTGGRAIVGAGTVVNVPDLDRLESIGCELCVCPNTNGGLIRRAKSIGMICIPGVLTPTEAFAAIEAGADALKLFPSEIAGPAGLKALRAVLPQAMPVFPVGGIGLAEIRSYLGAGASGFGFGSSIFAPGDSADSVLNKALALARMWRESL